MTAKELLKERNFVMIELVADLHTHTLASGHAYGTVREMAQAAAEAGMKMLGLTEHAPGVPGTVHPVYFSNVYRIPKVLYGVRIFNGSEVNVLSGGRLSLEQKFLDKLDYGIAGIHTICYADEGIVKNTENLIKCMENGKIRFVSHPDDDHTPLDYTALVPAAKELGVALEVNNSSFKKPDQRLNCVANYHTMLALCMDLRCPIVVDSDAHDPSEVGHLDAAQALLDEVGFDSSLVVNADEERILHFIETGKL